MLGVPTRVGCAPFAHLSRTFRAQSWSQRLVAEQADRRAAANGGHGRRSVPRRALGHRPARRAPQNVEGLRLHTHRAATDRVPPGRQVHPLRPRTRSGLPELDRGPAEVVHKGKRAAVPSDVDRETRRAAGRDERPRHHPRHPLPRRGSTAAGPRRSWRPRASTCPRLRRASAHRNPASKQPHRRHRWAVTSPSRRLLRRRPAASARGP